MENSRSDDARPRSPAPRNLFLATQHLVGSREDHLTEFFASALDTSPGLAADYLRLLLGAREATWGPQRLVRLTTQASEYEFGVPDLVLVVADTAGHERTIAVEHKIDAQETESIRGAPVGDLDAVEQRADPIKQLAWYLQLPGIDGVAYVRQSIKTPDAAVLAHERYIQPAGDDSHFVWRQFHPLLERHRSESLIVGWLADAFVHMGYTMPNARIGDLYSKDDAIRREARENLKKLWQPMRTHAERLGWKTIPGSIHEVYLESHPTSLVKFVWVNPLHSTRLVVRLTPWDSADAPRLFSVLRDALPGLTRRVPLAHEPELAIGTQRRQSGPEAVVQITTSMSDVVGDLEDVTEIEERLRALVIGLIEPIPQRSAEYDNQPR